MTRHKWNVPGNFHAAFWGGGGKIQGNYFFVKLVTSNTPNGNHKLRASWFFAFRSMLSGNAQSSLDLDRLCDLTNPEHRSKVLEEVENLHMLDMGINHSALTIQETPIWMPVVWIITMDQRLSLVQITSVLLKLLRLHLVRCSINLNKTTPWYRLAVSHLRHTFTRKQKPTSQTIWIEATPSAAPREKGWRSILLHLQSPELV